MTTAAREREILAACADRPLPAAVMCVNLHNFKAYNAVRSHADGDRLLAHVEARLRELGATWRTRGDELIVLAGGELAAITEQARRLTWRCLAAVGATESWRFQFADGRPALTVPYRSFQVICAPRCGIAELTDDGAAALAHARARCDDRAAAIAHAAAAQFAPLTAGPWSAEVRLAARACPDCGAAAPAVVDSDLGWAREQCGECGVSYERSDLISVLGEESDASYA